jgi:hypothetical protein
MQYRRFAFISLVLMGLITLWSCEYEKVYPEPLPPVTDTIHYSTDIQPIWNGSCNSAGCHGGATAPNLSEGTSYTALMNGGYVNTASPSSSKIYTEMASGGGMSQYSNTSDANLVLGWIQQGAKNN